MNALEKKVEDVAEAVGQMRVDVLIAQIEAAEDPVAALAELSDEDVQLVIDEIEKREALTVRRYGCPVIDLIPDAEYFRLKASPQYAHLLDIPEGGEERQKLFRMKCQMRREAEEAQKADHAALRERCRSAGRTRLTHEEYAEQTAIDARFKQRLAEMAL